MWLVLFMNMLWALPFVIGKLAMQHVGPVLFTALRMTIAGVVLLTYYALTTKRVHRIAPQDWLIMLQTVLFYEMLATILENWSLEHMSALKTNLLWSSLPFVSAFMGRYLENERLTKMKWLGMAFGIVGMIPVILLPDEREGLLQTVWTISQYELAMCFVVVSTAYGGFLVKRLLDKGYPLELTYGMTMLAGGVFLLGGRLALLPWNPELGIMSIWPVLAYSSALVLTQDVLAYGIYGRLLRRYSVTFLNFSCFLNPIFCAVFSWLVLHEEFYPMHYGIAFVLILTGLFFFCKEELVKEFHDRTHLSL